MWYFCHGHGEMVILLLDFKINYWKKNTHYVIFYEYLSDLKRNANKASSLKS